MRISLRKPQKEAKRCSQLSAAGNAAPPLHVGRKPLRPSPKLAPAPPPPRAGAALARTAQAHATSPSAPTRLPCAPTDWPASQPAHHQQSSEPGTTNCPGPTATTICQVLSASSARAAAMASDAARPVVRCESPRDKTGRKQRGVAAAAARRIPAIVNRTARLISNANARFGRSPATDFANAFPHSLCSEILILGRARNASP